MFVFLGKVIFLVVLCERAVLFLCLRRQRFLKAVNCPIPLCSKSVGNEQQNHRTAALIDANRTKVVSLITEPQREQERLID